jgi:stage IV sporulation protein FB
VIYPIGEMAVIGNLFLVKPIKRIFIICIGPLVNILLGIVFIQFSDDEILKFAAMANFCIGLFNMIPIYPLDGGRLLHMLLSDTIGVLNANELIIKISEIFIILYILLGMLQVVLYPYNISLICIGLYLKNAIKQEEFSLCLNFFENIFYKGEYINKNGGISTQMITVSENTRISHVLKYLKSNSLCKIYIVDKEQNSVTDITEIKLLEFVMQYGVQYTIKNVINGFDVHG